MQTLMSFGPTATPKAWYECDWTCGDNRKAGKNKPHVDYLGEGHRMIGSAGPPTEKGACVKLVKAAERARERLAREEERAARILAEHLRIERAKQLYARYQEIKSAWGLIAFDVICETENIERYDLMDMLRLGKELHDEPTRIAS